MKKPLRPPGAPTLWRLGAGKPPSAAHVVLLPGEQVPLLPVDLPEKLRGGARERVAERQIVEQLSIQRDHFEMHPFATNGSKNWARVAVVDSGLATAWRHSFGRGAIGAVPDFMALPAAEGLWAIEVVDDKLRARLGPDDGFAAEADIALVQLADLPPPKAILRLGDPHEEIDAFLDGLNARKLSNPKGLKAAGFPVLDWAKATGGLNLKNPPSAAQDRLGVAIKRWRLGVVAAILAAAAWVGNVVMQTRDVQSVLNRDKTLIESLVREHFLPSGPILDVRAQVSAVVDAAKTPDVVEVQTIPALDQFQIAAGILTRDGTKVLVAAWRPETGLELELEAADFTTLDDVIAALQDTDFLVEQLDSRAQQSGGVVAKLRLELFE